MPSPVAQSNDDVARAQTPAHVAVIAQDQMTRGAAVPATHLHARQSRLRVEQAKGFIAARLRIDIDAVSNRRRSDARSGNQRLTDVAKALIADSQVIGSRRTVQPSPDDPPVDHASNMPVAFGFDRPRLGMRGGG